MGNLEQAHQSQPNLGQGQQGQQGQHGWRQGQAQTNQPNLGQGQQGQLGWGQGQAHQFGYGQQQWRQGPGYYGQNPHGHPPPYHGPPSYYNGPGHYQGQYQGQFGPQYAPGQCGGNNWVGQGWNKPSLMPPPIVGVVAKSAAPELKAQSMPYKAVHDGAPPSANQRFDPLSLPDLGASEPSKTVVLQPVPNLQPFSPSQPKLVFDVDLNLVRDGSEKDDSEDAEKAAFGFVDLGDD